MKKTIIYLIRHSEALKTSIKEEPTENNQIKNEKIPLSKKWEELAKKISEMNELKNIEMLYSSHYQRAIQTAKYISNKNNIEIKVNKRLRRTKIRKLKRTRKTRQK